MGNWEWRKDWLRVDLGLWFRLGYINNQYDGHWSAAKREWMSMDVMYVFIHFFLFLERLKSFTLLTWVAWWSWALVWGVTSRPGCWRRTAGECLMWWSLQWPVCCPGQSPCSGAAWSRPRSRGGRTMTRAWPSGGWASPHSRTTGRDTTQRTSPSKCILMQEETNYIQFSLKIEFYHRWDWLLLTSLSSYLSNYRWFFFFSLRHVARLTDEKLLLVHGMEDDQVDVGQSWTLAQALISRGILFTQMVRYLVRLQFQI